MLETILAAIAILGGLATLHGNYRLVRDSGHEKPVRRYISLWMLKQDLLELLPSDPV